MAHGAVEEACMAQHRVRNRRRGSVIVSTIVVSSGRRRPRRRRHSPTWLGKPPKSGIPSAAWRNAEVALVADVVRSRNKSKTPLRGLDEPEARPGDRAEG